MKLIVGLGNPGADYAGHRHNIGFMAVERIAEKHGLGPWRKKFSGLVSEGELDGVRVTLLKPQTYMNLSGQSVGDAARFYKTKLDDVIVVHDELDLVPGKVRVKSGGSDAGHNGLRSISQHLGSDYIRVRLGIGHPGNKDRVHGWVLGNFAKADADWLSRLLDAVAEASPWLAKGRAERFQTEIARLMQLDAAPDKAPAQKPTGPSATKVQPASHAAGERARKSQNAIAENLRKWLAARKQ